MNKHSDSKAMKDLIESVESRLRAARVKMLFKGNWAFFGYLSMHLKIQPVEGLGTTATDGENFLYDPVALDKETVEYMEFDWAHECLHLVGLDLTRAPKNDVMVSVGDGPPVPLWNLASDLWINLKCKDEGFSIPPFVPIDEKYRGWSKDAIYDDLKQRAKQGPGKVPKGRVCGGCKKGKGKAQGTASAKDLENWKPTKEEIDKWKMRAKEAMEAATRRGTAPTFMEAVIKKLLHSKQDWRSILWQFCTRGGKDWRFTPPSRTGAARGIILPRLVPDVEVEHGVIVIDSSGSISDENLAEFMAEIEAICTMIRMRVSVIIVDAMVQNVFEFEPGDFNWTAVKITGRGGTAFEPAFEKVEELGYTPTFLVYFTDTWGSFPEAPPEYPVLWASVDPNGKVPWGEYISLREETI